MCLQQDRMAVINALSSYREDTNSILPVNPSDIFLAVYAECAIRGTVVEDGTMNAADEAIIIVNRALCYLIKELADSIG